MHTANAPSSQITFRDNEEARVALYARDVFGLRPGESPPKLNDELPDRASLIPDDDRDAAALAWSCWWSTIPVVARRVDGAPLSANSGVGSLERALLALRTEALSWSSDQSVSELTFDGRRRWEIASSAAQAVARDTATSLGDLKADTCPLPVRGAWRSRPTDGAAYCSFEVERDEDSLYSPLCETLVSHPR